MHPFVKPLSPDEDRLDIVLREIAEGKIVAEVDFDTLARLNAKKNQSKWATAE